MPVEKQINEFPELTSVPDNYYAVFDDGMGNYFKVKRSNIGVSGGGGGDTTPPTVTSVITQSTTVLRYVFSEATTMTLAGHSWKKNGSAWSASSISSVSSTTWDVTMGTAASSGDTLLRSYSTGHATVDTSSNELTAYTDSSITNSIGGSYDTDAAAFFTAAGITDTTQKDAVNALVLAIKAETGLWAKMKVIYPFVGGSASSHKFNLVNPTDSDAAFRATFAGSWTHSATGALGDGATAYADTHFCPFLYGGGSIDVITSNDYSIGAYTRKTTSTPNPGSGLFGNYTTSDGVMVDFYNSGDIFYSTGGGIINISPYSGSWNKLFSVSRFTSIDFRVYSGGTEIGNDTASDPGNTLTSKTPIYISARNNDGTAEKFFDGEITLFYGADHLTHAEMGVLATAVDTFNTSLSRA